MQFQKAYKALNAAQRQAVDTLEGPVLVIAGPGTGKTQLLSMRAANIVRQTDTLPNNILCLTFTESAALAMRKRLIALMGPDGNKVAVHTFHSFGADIINQYPEYFYNGARFNPADDMAGYEILRDIFGTLPHSNPLAKTMNGEFTALRDAQGAISHLKRAGLLPEELLGVLEHNQAFCDVAESLVAQAFDGRFSKKDFGRFRKLLGELETYTPEELALDFIKPLNQLCTHELHHALSAAEESGKTTPLTAWRNRWCEKNHLGKFIFKDRNRTKKLRALVHIYKKYQEKLTELSLYDFDDMVSLVAHTLESTPELRYNLQEQYLYLMVDEFQDTNGAQLRLLGALTDNPVNEDRPNVLAVGDDDQAIYAFQGAELSNILDFVDRYREPAIITLTDNYRSTAPILQHARQVITQGTNRLETALQHINKELSAHLPPEGSVVETHHFQEPLQEYHWISSQINTLLKNGVPAQEIAVLARNHRHLVELLPYLHASGIAVNYERRNNVLESGHIRELITLAETVVALGEQRFDVAESLLPELLSYAFWGLKVSDVWQLSLRAYKERRMWLEIMLEDTGKVRSIAEFLIIASHRALHEPLDVMLDILIGSNEVQVAESDENDPLSEGPHGPAEEFFSPYRAYYFNEQRLTHSPSEYLTLLSNIRAIRRVLANYRPNSAPSLRSFIDVIELHHRTNTPIVDSAYQSDDLTGVELMTAHKSKGLEFHTVFILSCQDEIWGRKTRSVPSSLHFPYNLPIEPAGSSYDDALRLFFVAMTRAKKQLYMTSHAFLPNGKESLTAEFLHTDPSKPIVHNEPLHPELEQHSPGWERRHLSLPRVKREVLLKPTLDTYKISATHLNNFIDITRGGPQAFLLQNLLRFPQAMTKEQVFGHAIHAALQRAHTHLAATGERRPVEDILHDFELQLQQCQLSERAVDYLLEKGSDVLQTYLSSRYDTFSTTQKAERNFASQHVSVNGIRLTGAIDLMHIDEAAKTITVVDYKTGKGLGSWRAQTDFDKIKMHKYKQQLMFYKLLLEHSREFSNYTVTRGVLEFVEADSNGQLHQLEMSFDPDELAQFTRLLTAVWTRVMHLDLPDVSGYDSTFAGLLAFEKDLLKDS